jgi:GDP-L-fucose synthase
MDLKKSKVLVTGAKGFLGGHVVNELSSRGISCTETDRDPGAEPRRDLLEYDSVTQLFDVLEPNLVIHLAAEVGGIGANQASPGEFFYNNMLMGLNVIEACRIFEVDKLVVIGTICAYPKNCPVPFVEDDLWNGYPEETNAPYGIAKKAMLTMLQAYRAQYGLNGIFLMPTNLYGPHDHFDLETSHVIPAMIRKFCDAQHMGSSEVVLWGTGGPTREFLYAEDAAKMIVKAAECYDSPEPLNLGGGREFSMREVASLVREFVGFDGRIRWDASRPDGQPRRWVDVSRAEVAIGPLPRTPFEEGLKKTIAWYKERHPC